MAGLIAVGAVLAASLASAPPSAEELRDRVRAHRQSRQATILREFVELLSIPNVASDEANIRRNADKLLALLRGRGLTARLLAAGEGPPAVYAELAAPGARRSVLVYAHYDGQPVDASRWKSDPWKPVLRDAPLEEGGREVPLDPLPERLPGEARLYARSASDDKAPVIGLLAALDALRAANVPLSVNLKVLLEGEEEAGSPNVERLLRDNVDLLKADLWLLCDGPVHQSRRAQLFFGARGSVDLELTLFGPARPLHSGHYGNWAPNPAAALAHLVAALRDPAGKVLIPGFYDDVRPPAAAERAALQDLPRVEADLRQTFAIAAGDHAAAPVMEGVLQPALNVRGLESGRVGALAANAIPTEARLSLDFRLVPDQTPERVRERVESHLRALGYAVVHETPDLGTRRRLSRLVRLEWGAGYPPARTALDLPEARALSEVVSAAIGAPVLRVPTLGGSVPMYLFQQIVGVPVVGLPIANHDNNQHGADENIRLQNLWDAIEVYAAVLARLGPALERERGGE